MDYVFIDGVAVLSLGYAMTLSYPERKLGKVIMFTAVLDSQLHLCYTFMVTWTVFWCH